MKLLQKHIGRIANSSASYFITYMLLSLVYFAHGSLSSSFLMQGGQDQAAFVWFLNWWPFALVHNENPFISPLCMATCGLQYVVGHVDPDARTFNLAAY